MRTIIIDEKNGLPFPPMMSLLDGPSEGCMPISREGYHHNPPIIKETAKKLAGIIGLKKGQRTIDIGYGSNLALAETMNELGMQAYGLDSRDGLNKEKYGDPLFVPPYFNTEQNGVRKYCGTIEEILHPKSQLRGHKFDLFTFWGSWESGGYNFTIGGEMGEFRVRAEHPNLEISNDKMYELMQKNREKVLSDSRSLLNPNGGLMIVSSRYALHGAGFAMDQLAWEKRIMLRLGQKYVDLGAEEVYFFGLSKNQVSRQLVDKEMIRQLCDDDVLFSLKRAFYESEPSESTVEAIKSLDVPLGRIDSVYGRF